MIDPCWLPSAIMQTVGALYAIFITIFILARNNITDKIENRNKIPMYNSKTGPVDKINMFRSLLNMKLDIDRDFKILTTVIAVTILYNGYLLYRLAITPPDVEYIINTPPLMLALNECLFYSFITLFFSVIFIANGSLYLMRLTDEIKIMIYRKK